MKCKRCGVEMEEGQVFCRNCGYVVPQKKQKGANLIVRLILCTAAAVIVVAGWLGL